MLIITAHKRSLQRLCFYTCLSVILSFTGGIPGQVHPLGRYTPWAVTPPWAGTPPGQVHPPGHGTPPGRYTAWQVHPLPGTPSSRYTPQDGTPPEWYTPGQVPGRYTPRAGTLPWAGTPPPGTPPLGRYIPLGAVHAGQIGAIKLAVRILLEWIRLTQCFKKMYSQVFFFDNVVNFASTDKCSNRNDL